MPRAAALDDEHNNAPGEMNYDACGRQRKTAPGEHGCGTEQNAIRTRPKSVVSLRKQAKEVLEPAQRAVSSETRSKGSCTWAAASGGKSLAGWELESIAASITARVSNAGSDKHTRAAPHI